ncbi:Archaeal PaREP1/PaREP8 family [Pyrobaculum oguniense TE7]|uniref:Archaeal PaREP1/PaREP8 family n=1 Tax=Pyrobaculum oguniense (strain DSM 13380 / JCM 10595 / TE7) TaxID=698757 RepID=H6Q8H2_PYROT|nr:Archaeal PaREP1/PaREP8 family [Pyrobaculum oguniense TE7]
MGNSVRAEVVRIPLDEIARARLEESKAEVEVAKKFIEAGLLRNAAGKAFQAWKSYLSYLAIKNQDLFHFEGYKQLGKGLAVPRKEWVLAVVPTTMLAAISEKLMEREPDVVELTALAHILHEYQYNGPDPSGVVSKIPSDEAARGLIQRLIHKLKEKLATAKPP